MPDFVAISDTHIGSAFSKQDLLYSFLEALPPETNLLLLGDIVDTWKGLPDSNFYAALSKFKSIRYFPGNHDAELMAAKILSPRVYKKRIFEIYNNRILFTHGDIFDAACGKDSIFNRTLDSIVHKISCFLGIDIRAKTRCFTHLFYNRFTDYYSNVLKSLEIDNCNILVYGHTHCPGIKKIEGNLLFNLGCWYEQPFAFFIKEDKYAFVEIKEGNLLPTEEDFNSFRGY